MNSKVTLNQLAESIAKATGSNAQTAKAFIQDLTEIIAEALSKGKSITITGLGTFTSNEGNVLWHPDDTLAENVNQPFAAFEPVELGDGVTEEILEGDIDTEPTSSDSKPQEKSADYTLPKEESATQPESQQGKDEEQKSESEPEPSPVDAESLSPDAEPDTESVPVSRSYLNPWMMLIIGILAGFIIGYFSAPYIARILPCFTAITQETQTDVDTPSVEQEPTVIMTDSVAVPSDTLPEAAPAQTVEAIEAPKVITDTISAHRYLTTMSRKYYGDYRFWVYIYLENKDKITDPDRISPGTVVVIPPAEKYGIDASNPQSVAVASEKTRAVMEKLDK